MQQLFQTNRRSTFLETDGRIERVEVEEIVSYAYKMQLIGEQAMMSKIEIAKYPSMAKNKEPQGRALSGIAKTEVVLLVISSEAFKLLCYEKIKIANELKTDFVFNTLTPLKVFP